MNVIAAQRPLVHGYSKLKNFETCPRRYYTVDVQKAAKEESVQIDYGERLHDAMYSRVVSGKELPKEFQPNMEPWAEKLTREIHPFQIIQCELKLATTKALKPAAYFDKNVWWRARIDYLRLIPLETSPQTFFCHIIDYKTGKPKDDRTQLATNAGTVLANYPDVTKIRTDFLWTEYNDYMTSTYDRGNIQQVWRELMPRINALEQAHATGVFPPKKCGLCREYCPVLSCEFNGKR